MHPKNDEIEWAVFDVDKSADHYILEEVDHWMVEDFTDIVPQDPR